MVCTTRAIICGDERRMVLKHPVHIGKLISTCLKEADPDSEKKKKRNKSANLSSSIHTLWAGRIKKT